MENDARGSLAIAAATTAAIAALVGYSLYGSSSSSSSSSSSKRSTNARSTQNGTPNTRSKPLTTSIFTWPFLTLHIVVLHSFYTE
jgi:hypothetical protein